MIAREDKVAPQQPLVDELTEYPSEKRVRRDHIPVCIMVLACLGNITFSHVELPLINTTPGNPKVRIVDPVHGDGFKVEIRTDAPIDWICPIVGR